MTSSLVGSEMCIRDRHQSAINALASVIGMVPPGDQVLQPNLPLEPQPVSYTHLTLPTICSV
eukprot:866372-Prorocentrum_lima.AAC.1